MKKLVVASMLLGTLLTSCTKELGSIHTMSTQDYKPNQKFELAAKGVEQSGSSLEECVNRTLKSIPKAAFLKNVQVSTKGKNVNIVADVWIASKSKAAKNPELTMDKYKKPSAKPPKKGEKPTPGDLKVGMKVIWDHPKAGKGYGIIAKIVERTAYIEKVIDGNGKPAGPVRLPLEILKLAR